MSFDDILSRLCVEVDLGQLDCNRSRRMARLSRYVLLRFNPDQTFAPQSDDREIDTIGTLTALLTTAWTNSVSILGPTTREANILCSQHVRLVN